MTPTILITRPQAAAQRFADHLRTVLGDGPCIVISPIMRIVETRNALDLTDIQTLIFTSRNGVEAYATRSERRDLPCYVVGAATRAVAEKYGLTVLASAEYVDLLANRMITDTPPGPCLHLRGAHGAGDLVGQLAAAGIEARVYVLYDQQPCALHAMALKALAGPNPVVLPLFSARSADLFFAAAPENACLYVAAISDAVARHVPNGRAERLLVAKTPDAKGITDALKQLLMDGIRVEAAKGAQ